MTDTMARSAPRGKIPVPKKQKSGGELIVSDRISSLPDSLLHHVLSFLPIEEAVATCLLSKRWKPLWLSMPCLNFVGTDFCSLDSFTQFVDAVLCLADLKPKQMFRLECESFYVYEKRRKQKHLNLKLEVPPIRINFWINAALNREVEHLELCFPYGRFDVELPTRIFSCNIVKVFKFTGVAMNTPSPVKLPSLKVLHLASVRFNDLDCMANLLSGCAVLEELLLNDLDVPNIGSKLNIARLEHLVSVDVEPSLLRSADFSNVTVLRLIKKSWSSGHDDWWSPLHDDIPTFYNLTRMEISCSKSDWNGIVKCLQKCPKLETLLVHEIEVPFNEETEVIMKEPILDIPQCLSSHLKKFSLVKCRGLRCELEVAAFIMKNARVLRSIYINSLYYIHKGTKHQMLKKLSSYPRASADCRLLFS